MPKCRGRRRAVGTRAPILARGETESALITGPRARPVCLWGGLKIVDDVTREPSRHSLHVDLRSSGGPRADRSDQPSWQARHDRFGPPGRISPRRDTCLVEELSCRVTLHRAGKADAEWLRREVQQPGDELLNEPMLRARPRRCVIANWRQDFNTAHRISRPDTRPS